MHQINKIVENTLQIKNKKKTLQFFEAAFQPQYDPIFKKTYQHPFTNEAGINLLISTAETLLNSYRQGAKIIGLGQSPAWFIATAALINNNNKINFDGVAFSGAFFDETNNGFLVRRNIGPTHEQILAYREYLIQKKLDPESICQNHTVDNPLVIVEHSHTGKGLISFLSILIDWADEKGLREILKDNVKIHLLMSPRMKIEFSMYNFVYTRQNVEHEFIISLANSDRFNDRLLPQYQFFKWHKDKISCLEFAQNLSAPALLAMQKIIIILDEKAYYLRAFLIIKREKTVMTITAGKKYISNKRLFIAVTFFICRVKAILKIISVYLNTT